jgi:hypothetical protein
VIRFVRSQLARRPGRTLTLGVGILVAALTFTLLTSASTTSALQIKGTIHTAFRSAYDILVRPHGSYTPLERRDGLVRDNYLSGIFGGITMKQWRVIDRIPGVEVAAPIANVGYILPLTTIRVPLAHFIGARGDGLYRVTTDWKADNGASTYPGEIRYLMVSSGRGGCKIPPISEPNESDPFAQAGPSNAFLTCVRTGNGRVPRSASVEFDVTFPILIAGVDPKQESRLVGLDRTLVEGRALSEDDTYSRTSLGSNVPVVVSSRTFVQQALGVRVEAVQLPPGQSISQVLNTPGRNRVARTLPGTALGSTTIPSGELYGQALAQMQAATTPYIADYWTVTPVAYQGSPSRGLGALTTSQSPLAAWSDPTGFSGWAFAPAGSSDSQFRQVVIHNVVLNSLNTGDAILDIKGRFDPGKLPDFSPLSRVPLETYNPPLATPADAASRAALHGAPLRPAMNLGGYLQQAPFMLTTLRGAQGFLSPRFFDGGNSRAPISVIRVRVSGVRGPDPVSLARIRETALAIRQRTGLAVDITAGSSPTPIVVHLPRGLFGRPAIAVREGWVKKGVAVVVLKALDRKSVALFTLVLVVTGLFLLNGALAAVRSRRGEIGTLRALGWSRPRVFQAVLLEIAVVGFIAGLVGTGIAALIVRVFSLQMPVERTLLVIPIGVLLAILAGVPPAWTAARALPLEAIRPPVVESGSARSVHGLVGMAWRNVWRLPGRSLLAVAGLFIGVAALALLLVITLAFRGALIGTALGAFISVQVRGVDYLAASCALVLGASSVADVLAMNVRDRAPELVTLRASGWLDSHIGRVIMTEGLFIGLLGSLAGASAGMVLAALAGGLNHAVVLGGALAAAIGVVVAAAASLVPALAVSRMATPALLAEE